MTDDFQNEESGGGDSAREGLFARGVELFNAGAYWEAHEAWEEIWKAIPGRERRFFQGLIQAAAAFHQWRRGRFEGAAEHFRRSARKLAPFPPVWEGIRLEEVRRHFLEWEELAADRASFPTVPPCLHWDQSRR